MSYMSFALLKRGTEELGLQVWRSVEILRSVMNAKTICPTAEVQCTTVGQTALL